MSTTGKRQGTARNAERSLCTLVLALMLAACGGGQEPTAPSEQPASRLGSPPRWPDEPVAEPRIRPLAAATDTGMRVDTSQRETVLLFLHSVYDASENVAVGWTGSFTGCQAGDSSAANKLAVERRVNWVRAMAGVPAAVRLDTALNQKA